MPSSRSQKIPEQSLKRCTNEPSPADRLALENYIQSFCDQFGLSKDLGNDRLQHAIFLYGEFKIHDGLRVRSLRSIADADDDVHTTKQLMDALNVKLPPDIGNSLRSLTSFRNRLLTKVFRQGNPIFTRWDLECNQTTDVCLHLKELCFLNTYKLIERLKERKVIPEDQIWSLDRRLEALRLLDENNLLSADEKHVNYFYVQHKVVKAHLRTFLTDESRLSFVDGLVKTASKNRCVVTRALNAWILEYAGKHTTDQAFVNRTLNNQNFYRYILGGHVRKEDFPEIADSESWESVRHLVTPILSQGVAYQDSVWSNIIGDSVNKYITNFKMMLRHESLGPRLVTYMRRFTVDNLKAKECKVNGKKCLAYPGGSFPISALHEAVEKGQFATGTFPDTVATEFKKMLGIIPVKDKEVFNPQVVLTSSQTSYNTFVQPVIELFNDKFGAEKYKLTKKDVQSLLTHLNVAFSQKNTLSELINIVRESILNLEKLEVDLKGSSPSKESESEYSLRLRLASWETSKHPISCQALSLHLLMRSAVPLPHIDIGNKPATKTKETLPDVTTISATTEDQDSNTKDASKDRGWSASPVAESGRTCIRIDAYTFKYISSLQKFQGSMSEYFNANNTHIRSVKRKIRAQCRSKQSRDDKKKVNRRRARCGLGGLPPEAKGWEMTSLETDGIAVIFHYERRCDAVCSAKRKTPEEKIRDFIAKYEGKHRLITDDRGRVSLSTTAEKKSGNDGQADVWTHFEITRSSYYKKTGIDAHNTSLRDSKPTEIAEFEKKISFEGGWKARTLQAYMKVLTEFASCGDAVFAYYSDAKHRLAKMRLWRRKRSFLQQRLAKIFLANIKEGRQVIYSKGHAKFKSHGKGEKAVPVTHLDKELKFRVQQLRNPEQQAKGKKAWDILCTTTPENMTTQMHHSCQKRMVNIKDEKTQKILRGWKCCPHCEAKKHHNARVSCAVTGGTKVVEKLCQVVHRDRNAAKNIWEAAYSILKEEPRPSYLCYHLVSRQQPDIGPQSRTPIFENTPTKG